MNDLSKKISILTEEIFNNTEHVSENNLRQITSFLNARHNCKESQHFYSMFTILECVNSVKYNYKIHDPQKVQLETS